MLTRTYQQRNRHIINTMYQSLAHNQRKVAEKLILRNNANATT